MPVRTCLTFMPRVSLPEHSRTKAMRSRWFGSMLAWILNTKADMSASAAVTTRLSAACARGGGAKVPSASSRSPTPKFLSALPKNTGVRWPSRNAWRSNALAGLAHQVELAADRRGVEVGIERRRPRRSSSRAACRRRRHRLRAGARRRSATSMVPTKSRPRPIGQVIGAVSSASVFSISSSRSNGSRLSRSILLMKVMIGMSRSRQTSNSLRVRASMPLAASITMTAESTAVSVR